MAKLNFTELFKVEKDLYIQNVASGNVSLQFGRGENTISFLLHRKRDPIVLTNHVPFKMIAESTDFRRILNRDPKVVQLLSEEEYNAYFKAKGKREKISPDDAIAKAETERLNAKKQVAPAASTAPKDAEEEKVEPLVNAEEAINPRCIHLCHQAAQDIPADVRMKPLDLLEQLKGLQDEFKMDDYEYILAHTSNKSIHTWAKNCQKSLSSKMADVEDESEAEAS